MKSFNLSTFIFAPLFESLWSSIYLSSKKLLGTRVSSIFVIEQFPYNYADIALEYAPNTYVYTNNISEMKYAALLKRIRLKLLLMFRVGL